MEKMNIQWFPGHMTKTRRRIQANLKLVDAVVEIIDARIPVSSRNPDLDKIIQNKPRMILMNKCDVADKIQTKRWIAYYQSQNIKALPVDCKSGKGLNQFIPTVKSVLADKIAQWEAKGMKNRSIHLMVVGIPNVGKSSFINRMAKKDSAKVEDRPGVTRGNQWFSIGQGLELLDTPGVLWPKFDDPEVGEKLAFTGAVKDQITDTELLAYRLLEVMCQYPTTQFMERFKLQDIDIENTQPYDLLEIIGKKRGMLMSGGRVNTERASVMILDEYRAGKLGNITLECV